MVRGTFVSGGRRRRTRSIRHHTHTRWFLSPPPPPPAKSVAGERVPRTISTEVMHVTHGDAAATARSMTFVMAVDTLEEHHRHEGFWPVPVGSTVQLGSPNRDFRVVNVQVLLHPNGSTVDLRLLVEPAPFRGAAATQ